MGDVVVPLARDESIKTKSKDQNGLTCIEKFEGPNLWSLISW